MSRKKNHTKSSSFTLIELIIVIVIFAILTALIVGNFITSLKKSRDTKRKGDLNQIQKAVEMYYEDNKRYPSALKTDGDKLCHPDGCDTKVYMYKVPVDPKTKEEYYYLTDSQGSYYKLYSYIENPLDQGEGVKQDGYPETTCFTTQLCKYGVSSPNVSLDESPITPTGDINTPTPTQTPL